MTNKILLLKSVVCAAALVLLLQASHADAGIVIFANLNTDLTTTNTVTGSGGGATSSTGLAGAGTFTYSVNYSGFDFDGDTLADSFSFDVTVAGARGTTVSNTGLGSSTAGPLGTGTGSVVIDSGSAGTVWTVNEGTGTRFSDGETLIWSVGNIQTTNTDTAFTLNANFDGFTGGLLADRNTNGTPSGVYGLGTGLNGYAGTSSVDGVLAGVPQSILHITSTSLESSGASNTGVSNVDFSFDVNAVATAVPEPSSLVLFAAGVGLMGLPRRRRLK